MKLCPVCNNNFDDDRTFCPRDGEVLQETPDSIVGRVIDGKYEVESFIAQGGMGAVYLARHILLGDRVVLKTLRAEMRTNAEWVKRFQREGKAARAFRHPNSVTVYDLAAGSDGLVYMVMEYVEGHTLDAELQRRGRLTPREAVEVLGPVADVLDAAHARGVVHRDLKPENVMLGRDERGAWFVKVLDLGIAKLIGGDAFASSATALTTAGQLLGTPYYMSPEQWGELPRDGHAEVDGRTDIYSLGVIVFELIAGRKPLTGQTLAELRQKHVTQPPPALETVTPGVSPAFSRAVARATAKDRADRPATAGQFIDELRAALDLPPRTRPSTPDDVRVTYQARAGSEADTANLPPDSLDWGRSDTPPTSEFGERGTDGGRGPGAGRTKPGAGRETVARGPGVTSVDAQAPRPAGVIPETVVAGAAPRPPRRSMLPLVAGGALALLLLAGIGGWLAWRRAQGVADGPARPTPNAPNVPAVAPGGAPAPPVSSAPAAPPAAAAPKAEVLSYWLEVFERAADTEGRRVAETSAALATDQRFRFHFNPRRRGYLYIVGPGGDGNALMMLLTAQGAGPLKSNLVVGGADFAFPNWTRLRLAGGAGTEDYTVIFSPTPLVEPSFLTAPFQHELTPAEVKQFEELRARHGADAVALEARADGVAVAAPEQATAAGAPVIFDIRISHR